MPLNDPLNDGVSIWVGGKVSNARHEPMFSKLAIPYLPNNPPRWPEVTDAVKNLVELWAKHAKNMREWVNGLNVSVGRNSLRWPVLNSRKNILTISNMLG
jgi:dissimilatory sulfite reductase (desulfoviridin) alpha/beta subunit